MPDALTTETTTTDLTENTTADQPSAIPSTRDTEAAQHASDLTPVSDDAPAPVDEIADDDAKNPNREAAKYRRQLREAETTNATQLSDIRELQSEVVRLNLVSQLKNTEDFTQFIGIDKVLGDDGRIDRSKLDSEMATLLTERPYLRVEGPKPPRTRPQMPKGTPVAPTAPQRDNRPASEKHFGASDSSATWHQALDGKNSELSDIGPAARSSRRNHKVGLVVGTTET
jgi:hypothetical protein